VRLYMKFLSNFLKCNFSPPQREVFMFTELFREHGIEALYIN
jgi:hypothetical protein